MVDKKRIAMAGGTAACIGAIGFFMQNGATVPQGSMPVASASVMNAAPGVGGVQTPVSVTEVSLTSAETELVQQPEMPVPQDQTLPQAEDAAAMSETKVSMDVSVAEPAPAEPAAEPAVVAEATAEPVPVAKPAMSEPVMAEPALAQPETNVPQLVSMDSPEPQMADPELAEPKIAEPKTPEQCDITMSGSEMAGALVKLGLDAPCMPNERVTMHHNGMMFTETTDDSGALNIVVPALAENAVFIASFANSEGAVANVDVTSLDLFDRVVVQSGFANGVNLHALEFGAEYDDRGHVWANAAGDIADAAIGKGGFMLQLGNPTVSEGTSAQVYTFPTGMAEQAGDVTLSVEIEVTKMNCGHEIEAQALQITTGGQPKVQTLDLTMPDCDAVGDFLVLKNLVNDLKVAANTQ